MRNIIITGGGFENKGAEAMTHICVYELKKRFPEHEIYIYVPNLSSLKDEDKHQFNFSYFTWYPPKFAKAQSNPILKLMCKVLNKNEYNEAISIYKNTDLMIDISGYALGDNWSYHNNSMFLQHIMFAKAFNIPVYLLPQSFGPFPFTGENADELNSLAKELLPYAKKIFVREQTGYDYLVNTYNLTNVELANDLVLCSKEIDLSLVYKKTPEINIPDIAKNSVAIIPNKMNTSICSETDVLNTYCKAIDTLLSKNKVVYLIYHSVQDIELCKSIKEKYSDNSNVIFINRELSCIEFNEIIPKFDFAIASRFHSVVHAYKNAVPCIVIGWAEKYHNLAKLLHQSNYVYSISDFNDIDFSEVISKIDENVKLESDTIKKYLTIIQNTSCFDQIQL